MAFPAIDDTIIAVSSGWEPSPVGIVRLSGPESFPLAEALGSAPPKAAVAPRSLWTEGRIQLDEETSFCATVLWFRQPRSYTGQDLVELHTPGCLSLLRELCGRLIELGARRALPGEFTARAFLSGKLGSEDVEDVLRLLHADSEMNARQVGRSARAARQRVMSDLRERLANLLALIEAGIDFVEEEDIRFVTASDTVAAIDGMLQALAPLREHSQCGLRAGKPHVALAGLPNAGKSTLFNALLDYERAMVSPVLGTTRDVLSAEVEVAGVPIVLQDCAGLGQSADELDLAAHVAAEQAADRADLVLWVHAADAPWTRREARVAARIPGERRLLLWNKVDLEEPGAPASIPAGFGEAIRISAATGAGLLMLQETICRRLSVTTDATTERLRIEDLRGVLAALERARSLARGPTDDLAQPELVALELRTAYELLSGSGNGWLVEDLLGRIFSQFCVGK